MTLQSYEPHVQGVRNLVDISLTSRLSSPPRLLFISSVGVLLNIATDMTGTRMDEKFVEATAAEGSGYSESKCERLLEEASLRSKLRPIVIRVGQASGSVNGAWKASDWVPSLIRSSIYLKCLPDSNKTVSWMPADLVAASIPEMRNASPPVLHLASPIPVAWRTLFTPISEILGLPLVPYHTWLDSLEHSDIVEHRDRIKTDKLLPDNPALLLLDFFRSAARTEDDPSKEAIGLPRLSLTQALQTCKTLREMEPLTSNDALGWVRYWRQIGFIRA